MNKKQAPFRTLCRSKKFETGPGDQGIKGSREQKRPESQSQRSGLANGGEPAEVTQVTLAPVETQVPLRAVPAEKGHAAVITRVTPDRAERDDRKLPLQFGLVSTEGQKLPQGGRTETALVQLVQNDIGGHRLVEVEERDFSLARSAPTDRKILVVDVAVLPVVPTGGDQVSERHVVVDDDVVATRDHAIRHEQFGDLAAQGLVGLDPAGVLIGTAEVFDLFDQGDECFHRLANAALQFTFLASHDEPPQDWPIPYSDSLPEPRTCQLLAHKPQLQKCSILHP